MDNLIALATGPVGSILLSILVVVIILKRSTDLAVFVLSLMKKAKDSDFALAADICVGVFLLVEKLIPDDTKNKTAKKTDEAMKEFIKAWNAAKGKDPDDQLKEWARGRFANLAYDHKIGRSLRPGSDNG
jgi:hypothetical protein